MPKVFSDKIVFDQEDFTRGLVPGFGSGLPLVTGPGLAFASNFNPFPVSGILGAASPGPNPADVTNVAVVDGVQVAKALARGSTNYLYTLGNGKIHQTNVATDTTTNGARYPWTMGDTHAHGGGPTITPFSAVVYDHLVSSTVRTDVFYSWDDGTDGDVGIFIADGSADPDENYMSTVPTSGAVLVASRPHPLIVGDDGILYIGNAAASGQVGSYDGNVGTDGAYNGNALDLPPGFVITGFSKDPDKYLVIYAYSPVGNTPIAFPDGDATYNGQAYAFFWNYRDPSFQFAVNLDDNYVNGGFQYKGVPGCFTWGRGMNFSDTHTAKLRLYNGKTFDTLVAASGDIPGQGGVEIMGDSIVWTADGKIWKYGPSQKGFPSSLQHVTSGSGTTDGGIVANVRSNVLYASTGATTSGGLQKVGPSNYHSSASMQSLTVEPLLSDNKIAEVTKVKTYFSGVTSGGRALKLDLVTDRGNTTTTVFSGIENTTAFGTAESSTSRHIVTEDLAVYPKFGDLRLDLTWSTGSGATAAPQVNRVEVYYTTYTL